MAEKSFFYDGTTKGDANLAPYSADVYAAIRSILHESYGAYIFGPLTSGNPFAVVPVAGMDVLVTADANNSYAYIFGVFCELTASQTFTISPNTSGKPRIDRIVLRVDWNTETVSLVQKMGTPATIPEFPSLAQSAFETWELPLARIYVPSGLAAVTANYIIDEREILERTESYYSNENLMPNSEFMAGWGTGIGFLSTAPTAAYWDISSVVVTGVQADKFDEMQRGSTIDVTIPSSGDYITHSSPSMVLAGYPITYRILVKVISGEIYLQCSGVRVFLPPTNGVVEVIIRTTGVTSLSVVASDNQTPPAEFKLGQITASHGLTGAPFASKKEFLFFNTDNALHTNYDGLTGKSTGSTDEHIESFVSAGISALLMQMMLSDSGSAAATTSAALEDVNEAGIQLREEITNMGNSAVSYQQGLIYPDYKLSTSDPGQQFTVNLVASGANTMLLGLLYLGCAT